jgi:nitrite reductase/ring-hydroxylating ferredoxin subunit
MQVVEIGGKTILLLRGGEIVHALGATCPHATGRSPKGCGVATA